VAIAYESDGGTVFAASANNGAVTVPLPATRPVGSVLLFIGWCRLISATVGTAPSGYTLLSTHTSATASGGRIWVYGRIVDGSEAAPTFAVSNAVTGNSGDLWGAAIYCYSDVDTSGGISGIFDATTTVQDASGTTTCTYPAITTATSGAMLVRTLARFRDAADTFTPTASPAHTEREDLGSTVRTGGQAHLQDFATSTTGAQASVTVAPSNTTAARYLALSIALKPNMTITASGTETSIAAHSGLETIVGISTAVVDSIAAPSGAEALAETGAKISATLQTATEEVVTTDSGTAISIALLDGTEQIVTGDVTDSGTAISIGALTGAELLADAGAAASSGSSSGSEALAEGGLAAGSGDLAGSEAIGEGSGLISGALPASAEAIGEIGRVDSSGSQNAGESLGDLGVASSSAVQEGAAILLDLGSLTSIALTSGSSPGIDPSDSGAVEGSATIGGDGILLDLGIFSTQGIPTGEGSAAELGALISSAAHVATGTTLDAGGWTSIALLDAAGAEGVRPYWIAAVGDPATLADVAGATFGAAEGASLEPATAGALTLVDAAHFVDE
jgi:hypothetical protein